MRLHKWSRPRLRASASLESPPVCTVCGLQAVVYSYAIRAKGRVRLVVDNGEVWGSNVPIQYPRAGFWCKGSKK